MHITEISAQGTYKRPMIIKNHISGLHEFSHIVEYHYDRAFLIDGCRFLLCKNDNGDFVLLNEEAGAITLSNLKKSVSPTEIEDYLCGRLQGHACKTMYDVVVYFQNNYGFNSIQLWQIKLAIL